MMQAIERNTRENGTRFFGLGIGEQGVVHIIGPELDPDPTTFSNLKGRKIAFPWGELDACLPAARFSHEDAQAISSLVVADPQASLSIDLDAVSIAVAGRCFPFTMPDSDHRCLPTVEWDTTSVLLANEKPIRTTAAAHIPCMNGFRAIGGNP
jgi:hypothetical protein